MIRRSRRRRRLLAVAAGLLVGALATSPAAAHPLGNFSVNHHHRLTVGSGVIVDEAVIDRAEIPTAQAAADVDTDGDGAASAVELRAHASSECASLADHVAITVDGAPVTLSVAASAFAYHDGQAGLPTSRLDCRFEAAIDLASAGRVEFSDTFGPERVGWREVVVVGDGTTIANSSAPSQSITDDLRAYPDDLLSSPLDVRDATFDVVPGAAAGTAGAPGAVDDREPGAVVDTGPLSGVFGGVGERFDDLVGRRDLTVGVGTLAIALALILGASHALLPGHGKTLMAAYIAGRQGSARDAVVVGATVTATHTGGVLALGLALTLSTSLAGEQVLGWLGVTSGLILTALGVGLIVSNLRHRGAGRTPAHGHHHHCHHGHHGHHVHHHDHDHDHDHDRRRVTRRGLVGMGVAGGLVPSPSALVILLSAIALGRTWFGVLLVLAYGLGMAGTLTLAGVMLVVLRDRLRGRVWVKGTHTRRVAAAWTQSLPYLTAALVLMVGAGLAIRSAALV